MDADVSIGDGMPSIVLPGDDEAEGLPEFGVAICNESVASTHYLLFDSIGTMKDYAESLLTWIAQQPSHYCSNCQQETMPKDGDWITCPNAQDLCIDCCGEVH